MHEPHLHEFEPVYHPHTEELIAYRCVCGKTPEDVLLREDMSHFNPGGLVKHPFVAEIPAGAFIRHG